MSEQVSIFINNFNCLRWPRSMAQYLDQIPEAEVVFVDNGSTYPPLLNWYADCPYRVVRLCENLGPRAPWLSGVVDRQAGRYYVVTDPDLDLNGVPLDVLSRLQQGLQVYPDVMKVGLSLSIQELDMTLAVHQSILDSEMRHWANPEQEGTHYRAEIETTFAMYERGRDLPFTSAMRTSPPYVARHLPWSNPVGEEQAFCQSAQRREFVRWPLCDLGASQGRQSWNELKLADLERALCSRFVSRRDVRIRKTGKYLAAVMIPTRCRGDLLQRCVQSFVETTTDLSQVQFLIKADDDDPESMVAFNSLSVPNKRLLISPRGRGYADLHLFYDGMSRQADATWLISWNDDAHMQTPGWDRALATLNPPRRERHWLGNEDICAAFFSDEGLFPAVTRTMVAVMGCWSKHTHQDTYIIDVTKLVRCMCPLPEIRVAHRRGEPGFQDNTFHETQAANAYTSPSFSSLETRSHIVSDARRLMEYILRSST